MKDAVTQAKTALEQYVKPFNTCEREPAYVRQFAELAARQHRALARQLIEQGRTNKTTPTLPERRPNNVPLTESVARSSFRLEVIADMRMLACLHCDKAVCEERARRGHPKVKSPAV